MFLSAFMSVLHRVSSVAVGPVEAQGLAREAKAAHPGLGQTSTAPPGVRDGEAHAAVPKPAPVAAVQALELPRRVQLPDQRQLPRATPTRPLRLSKVQGPRQEKDRS